MTWTLLVYLLLGGQNRGFVVVVAKNVPFDSLSRHQLQQIFLGSLDRVAGVEVSPVLLWADDPLQIIFEKAVFGQPFDLENHWVTQKIKQGTPPPRKARNWALVVAYVQRNPGFIGVVPETIVGELDGLDLKVVQIENL